MKKINKVVASKISKLKNAVRKVFKIQEPIEDQMFRDEKFMRRIGAK